MFPVRIGHFERIGSALTAALEGIRDRRVIERLRSGARDAERTALAPVEDGAVTLVPDGDPAAAAPGEAA
jgi:hypothetical protein